MALPLVAAAAAERHVPAADIVVGFKGLGDGDAAASALGQRLAPARLLRHQVEHRPVARPVGQHYAAEVIGVFAPKDLTVAPNSAGRCTTATSMPGKVTSRVNWAVPLPFAGTSTRGNFRAISLKSLGSFRATSAGGDCAAALAANLPKLACRYVAEVAEVTVDSDGKAKVDRVVCAVDCGVAVNPDVMAAQMEGGIRTRRRGRRLILSCGPPGCPVDRRKRHQVTRSGRRSNDQC
jgi:CO/xanthine dehydrogenase Mo-binding subunit